MKPHQSLSSYIRTHLSAYEKRIAKGVALSVFAEELKAQGYDTTRHALSVMINRARAAQSAAPVSSKRVPPIKPTRSRAKQEIIRFDAGGLRDDWNRLCQKHDANASEVLREAIRRLLGQGSNAPILSAVRTPYKQGGGKVAEPKKTVRYEIRLLQSEKSAIEDRIKMDGFDSVQQWIIALVRTTLTDQPQYAHQELQALGESNRQLLAIGRNLNQIAHALNANKGRSVTGHDGQLIEELAKAVKLHVRKVGDSMRASVYRWSLTPPSNDVNRRN